MEKEISSGAMLGIVLIALAAIIGLGFGVFAIAKGTANEGVTKVQENLGAVAQSDFTDYDQKIVTGTQVISAYQNFEGKNTAVLIMTQATKDKSDDVLDDCKPTAGDFNGIEAYKTAAFGNDAHKGLETAIVHAYQKKGASASGGGVSDYIAYKGVVNSKNEAVDHPVFINYNAILGSDEAAMYNNANNKGIYFDTNCWRATAPFEAVGGKVQFNAVSGNLSKSGMMEYVPSGARYQAYLIKDVSGTVMGVAFEQIGAK